MKKRLILLAASLAMLLVATAALAQESGDEVRCLLPEGCGPVLIEDELLCFLPEGCDINGDDVPDLRSGEPVPDVGAGTGAVQYDNAFWVARRYERRFVGRALRRVEVGKRAVTRTITVTL